ncbi:ADAMTS-like protein 5 [Gopherus evgoodei]|uniref:ADAMTS-like protein 5 n=1 Tax=Gopherus evgoodei TaxID=1825980 RepID=UPI0011CFB91F|nr:ADAMTS-like protein 5 [Gopherus evgoodei]
MAKHPPDARISGWRGAGTESQEGLTSSRLTMDSQSIWHSSLGTVLLLAWLSVGWGIGSTQGTASRTLVFGLEPQPRHRRQPGRGEWTSWGGWSACSSTCGDGASFRTRKCIRFPEEELCAGEPRQYRVCKLHECPGSSVPFRAMQCSLYDGKPILGSQARYQWVPFHGAPNLCDLNCLAVGHNFYYTFGRVLDGTRCSPGSPDLCISGQCLTAGCDGILGSGSRSDACGLCDGRNDSCLFVQRVFRAALPSSGFFGYKNVTRIPAGAMHIKVTDRSRNYLALMNGEQRYVINGDWAIDWPGAYEVAGTTVRYARDPDNHETLEAAGPTEEDLHIMVLFQEPNPGIEYEYWLPRERHGHLQSDSSPLRQPHPRGIYLDPPSVPQPGPWTTLVPPTHLSVRDTTTERSRQEPRDTAQTGSCGRCQTPKGKSQRIHHYCQSDFVFRARILAKRPIGQEMRYDVQVKHTYRNRFPLVHREYVWVSNACDCPQLLERREYLLMARRHVNYEHTLNRILLQRGSYARPWSPREDKLLWDIAGHCTQSRPT